MTAFRADPTELSSLSMSIRRSEPFTELADGARRLAIPGAPSESSLAIERFSGRLVRELTDLATATGSLGQATRSAAVGYQGTEDSIGRLAGG